MSVPRAPITIGIIVTFMFHSFFNTLAVLILLPTFLQFYSVVSRNIKVHNSVSSLFLFFFLLLIISSSGRQTETQKLLWEFVRLIFQDRFWFVYIPFVHKVKFLAQFPVDHLSHPVISSLIFFRLICDWSFRLYHHITYISLFSVVLGCY